MVLLTGEENGNCHFAHNMAAVLGKVRKDYLFFSVKKKKSFSKKNVKERETVLLTI